MKKSKKILTIVLAVLAVSCLLFACGEQAERTGLKVVYELEGGVYNNGTDSVEVRYNFPDGVTKKIKPLEDKVFGSNGVSRQGFTLDGWYRTKIQDGEKTAYLDKWNFDEDSVDENGITLYAKWLSKAVYKYSIGYYDGENFVEIGSCETKAGIPFGTDFVQKEVLAAADKRNDFTATGEFFVDKEMSQKVGDDFEFEESEDNQTKIIVAKYIEGQYKIVRSTADLLDAINSDTTAYQGKALYIMNDLDLGGDVFDMSLLFQADEIKGLRYTGIFGADGAKTLSNFVIATNGDFTEEDYDGNEIGTVRASILGDLVGVTIKDVNFKKVEFQIDAGDRRYVEKVVMAPLCGSAENCIFENVKIEITAYKLRLLMNEPEIQESKNGKTWEIVLKCKGDTRIRNCSAVVAEQELVSRF